MGTTNAESGASLNDERATTTASDLPRAKTVPSADPLVREAERVRNNIDMAIRFHAAALEKVARYREPSEREAHTAGVVRDAEREVAFWRGRLQLYVQGEFIASRRGITRKEYLWMLFENLDICCGARAAGEDFRPLHNDEALRVAEWIAGVWNGSTLGLVDIKELANVATVWHLAKRSKGPGKFDSLKKALEPTKVKWTNKSYSDELSEYRAEQKRLARLAAKPR